jgi:hypothetical protein
VKAASRNQLIRPGQNKDLQKEGRAVAPAVRRSKEKKNMIYRTYRRLCSNTDRCQEVARATHFLLFWDYWRAFCLFLSVLLLGRGGKSGSLPNLGAIRILCFSMSIYVVASIFSQKRKIEYDRMIQMYGEKKSHRTEIKNLLIPEYQYKYYLRK